LVYFDENWQGGEAIQGEFGVVSFKSHSSNHLKMAEFSIVMSALLSSGLGLFM
jgi:hypothetical protein